MIVVTHDLRDVLGLADRVLGLSAGRVAVDAAPREAATDLPELDVRVPEGAFDDRPVNTGADDTASDTVDS